MIVYDIGDRRAEVAARLIRLMSGGAIRCRGSWLIRPGEPVWRWEP